MSESAASKPPLTALPKWYTPTRSFPSEARASSTKPGRIRSSGGGGGGATSCTQGVSAAETLACFGCRVSSGPLRVMRAISNQLAKLGDLRDRGLVTEEE